MFEITARKLGINSEIYYQILSADIPTKNEMPLIFIKNYPNVYKTNKEDWLIVNIGPKHTVHIKLSKLVSDPYIFNGRF